MCRRTEPLVIILCRLLHGSQLTCWLGLTCTGRLECRVDTYNELQTGEIYGQTGDGSPVFTYRTEARAIAEVQSPGIGQSAACVYDRRVWAGAGQRGESKRKGWVRWGHPKTTEVVLGSWAVGVSVGWLCLGFGWCVLRGLERRYECSSAAEYWGVGVLCCIHKRSSERQILMEDLGGEGSGTEDEGEERHIRGHGVNRDEETRSKESSPLQLYGGTK